MALMLCDAGMLSSKALPRFTCALKVLKNQRDKSIYMSLSVCSVCVCVCVCVHKVTGRLVFPISAGQR